MNRVTVRHPRVQVLIEHWDFDNMRPDSGNPDDITNYVLSVNWSKSIKSPEGGGQITLFPQREAEHFITSIQPMDVLIIREWGTTKFVGYVQRLTFSGAVSADGRPQRSGTIQFAAFASLISEAAIGLNVGVIGEEFDLLATKATELSVEIADIVREGASYTDIVVTVLDSWFSMLESILNSLPGDGLGTKYKRYVDTYFDYSSLEDFGEASLPREFMLFNGNEEELTVWQVLSQLIEQPFFELWSDCGPRTLQVAGTTVDLPSDRDSLVLRPTPFNGAVNLNTGQSEDRFGDLRRKKIGKTGLQKFTISRDASEAYSFFATIPAAFDMGNRLRVLAGEHKISTRNVRRYLYKPLTSQLFFIRTTDKGGDGSGEDRKIREAAANGSQTLLNWFEQSDQFFNGAVSFHVPRDSAEDVYIGERAYIENIEGDMYVEGVSHEWSYGGPLTSTLSVSRWYNNGQQVRLSDRLFRRQAVAE